MLHTVYAFKYSYITVGNGRHQIILTQFNISFLVLMFLRLGFGHNCFKLDLKLLNVK